MPARRDTRNGGWYFRTIVKTFDGRKLRLFGTPGVPGPYQDLAATKVGALEAEQRAIRNACTPKPGLPETKKEVPTFAEWFRGSFWHEWVIGRKNKPSEVRSKTIIYDLHLEPRFGTMRLDEITTPVVARFRADLVAKKLSDKRINNILAVLSKPMK